MRSTLIGVMILLAASTAFGQGFMAPSAGPINSSMAGASTAAPVDFGSSYWNPAALSGLENQEFLLGSSLIFPSIHLESAIKAGSILGQYPATSRYGLTRSDSGVSAGLATGVSFRLSDDSPWTFGLGVFGLGGGNVNFPGQSSNPVLSPRNPPKSFGLGPIYANTAFLGINPMASLKVTDNFFVGGGPVISSGTATFTPAFFAPGSRDAYGTAYFPNATNARPFWGGGFQFGALYKVSDDWNVGFSYKSPVWQGKWDYDATTKSLSSNPIGLQATLPAIYSWGVAYKGFSKTLIDVDLRYFDYANTRLFGTKPIDGGLGWNSIMAVAVGGQYAATDRITLRAGYLYNMNPIKATGTLFNVQAPAITTNTLTMGTSFKLTEDVTLTSAWMHAFRNSIEGPILQVPGTNTKLDAQVDSLIFGLNVTFGKKHKPGDDIPLPPLPTAAVATADNGTAQ